MQKSLQDRFDYLMSIVPALNKIEINNFLKYNNQKYKIGATEEEQISNKPVSPFQRLLNIILGQTDFVKKQYDIIKFANYYLRSANEGEAEAQDWLYCRKSNAPLLPCFKADLAQAYVTGGPDDYEHVLEYFKATIGKLSDDGDYWCDVNSGWQICPVDFDVEEGYEEGFKVSTRAVMEEDAGNKIVSALAEKGMPMGTLLAFAMAVTGLSLPEAMLLKSVMKTKLLAIYFATVATGIIFVGIAFNLLLGFK